MPEINVTCLIGDIDPCELSSSVAERGKNAGPETWANSINAAKQNKVVSDGERAAVREFFEGFGAWEKEEIDAWSEEEIDALVLQYAAGDLRELQSLAPGNGLGEIDWQEADKLSNDGVCAGRLFVTDDKQLYIYIGD